MNNQRKPRVLDVGNCGHDHGKISNMLKQNFAAELAEAASASETLERLSREKFDLILVNRKLDHDYSDGIEIIKLIKACPEHAAIPVMLVTNYAEHQELAVQAGALWGFGKLELAKEETRERLAAVLSKQPGSVANPAEHAATTSHPATSSNSI